MCGICGIIHLDRAKIIDASLVRQMCDTPKIERLGPNVVINSKLMFGSIRISCRIAKQHPQVELRFVGSGLLRSKLEQLVRARGLENRVSLAGIVIHENLQDELSHALIFIILGGHLRMGPKKAYPALMAKRPPEFKAK